MGSGAFSSSETDRRDRFGVWGAVEQKTGLRAFSPTLEVVGDPTARGHLSHASESTLELDKRINVGVQMFLQSFRDRRAQTVKGLVEVTELHFKRFLYQGHWPVLKEL